MSVPGLYERLLRLFPASFRDRHAAEAAATFRALWAEATVDRQRTRLALRCFGRLPGALLSEWLSHLGAPRSPHLLRVRELVMDRWTRNLRVALRSLARAPSFTWTVVLLLGLGVGAVTTIATIVDHVILRALPYPAADRLVYLEHGSHSGPLFHELGDFQTVEQWGGAYTDDVNLVGNGPPERLERASVTEDFFSLFGASALRGRLLRPDDDPSSGAVVLSESTWRQLWGADPDLVGRTISLDGSPALVVGILDGSFATPEALVGQHIDVWKPVDWSAEAFSSHDYSVLEVAGRLAPGTTAAAAQAEMDALMVAMAPVDNNYRLRDSDAPKEIPLTPLAEVTVQRVRQGLSLLFGAVAILLLVACANVANLFLARGLERQQEMSVRHALGAGRLRLVEQLLAESLVLGLVGGLLGVALSALGLRTFLALNPQTLPREASVHLDLRVLGFAAALGVLTALTFGLLPALRAARENLAGAVRGATRTATEGRGVRTLRSGLVVAEVALSLTLVAGAGLLLRSFLEVQGQSLGIDPSHVWAVPVTPAETGTTEEWLRDMEAIRTALSEVPGARSATVGLTVPMQMTGGRRCCWSREIEVAGRDEVRVMLHPVSAEYFNTFQLAVLAGRGWDRAESTADPAPIVISEPLATVLYGSAAAAVGQTLDVGFSALITGVAADDRHYGAEYEHGPALYLPLEQLPFVVDRATFAVRMEPSATDVPRQLRDAVWSVAPGLPVPAVRSLEDMVREANAGRRFDSALFGSLAALALLLAAGGLYGLLLYVAGRRRRDLAIRLALGASRGHIERSLLLGGLGLTGLGVLLGLGGAWVSGRLLANRLWGVDTHDLPTMVGSALLLLTTAVVASWLPARRAGRTDPLETLRQE
ncbi:MAG: ADOP family duplicated permease [Gemmatimonadota bacterium]